jgi:hypothetical protein
MSQFQISACNGAGSGFYDYDRIYVEQYKLGKLGVFLNVLRVNDLLGPPHLD